MKSIIFVSLALSVFNSQLKSDERWSKFKEQYNKSYLNTKEEVKRYNIFKIKDAEIKTHNEKYSKGETLFTMAHNQFSDMTIEELRDIYLNPMKHDEHEIADEFFPNTSFPQAPSSLSYKKYCLPPLDQGQCGSCWAFAASAQVEAQYAYRKGSINYISPQYVLDCSNGGNCGGGYTNMAIDFMKNYGGALLSEYPYVAQQQNCNQQPTRYDYLIKDSKLLFLKGNEENLKEILSYYGPVAIAIYVTDSFFNYQGGIYYDNACDGSCQTTNHAVLLVGYGSDNYDYWLIKNSWGTRWGDSGYIKMIRNWNNNCNVACEITFAII